MSNVLDLLNSQNSSVANGLNNTAASTTAQAQPTNDPIIPTSQLPDPNAATNTDPQGAQQPAARQGDSGNWFTKLLPTIGSIAAPALGAAFAPVTGGASLLAGLALAGAGSAAGKLGENALEGKNLGTDVGASALEGGIGQLAGGAIGKVGGALLGKVGQGAEKAGAGMVQKQFGDQIDKVTAQHLIDHGVTSRDAAMNIANQVTGSGGHLPAAINNAFKSSDKVVNISDLEPSIIKNGRDNTGLFSMDKAGLTPGAQKTALANMQSILDSHMGAGDMTKIPGKGGASVPLYANGSLQNALPENVFSMAKQFEKLGYGADAKAYDKMGNAINPDQASLGQYYKSIANTLNERAFGVGQDAIPLTDGIRKEVLDNLSGIAESNPQAYKTLADQINNAGSLQDLRSIQAPWVKVSQGDRIATAIANGQGGVSAGDMLANAAPIVGGSTGGVKGLATGLALKAMNSPAGNAAGASTLNRVSNILSNPNMQKIVSQAATIPTQAITHAPTDFTGPAGSGQAIALPQGADAMQNPNLYQEVMGSNNLNALPVQSALINDMHRGVGDNQNYLADPSVLAAIGKLQGGVGAQSQIPALIQAYNAAGGAQGAAGGLLANLGGAITGGPAAQYQARADALQKSIQEATGQNVQLPGLGMNQEAANSAIQQLLAVLQSSGTHGGVTAGLPLAQ